MHLQTFRTCCSEIDLLNKTTPQIIFEGLPFVETTVF